MGEPEQTEYLNLQPSPAEPTRWGLGRVLRIATGVREDILAHVPSERARYTSMGGVVVGTALIAMLSMSVALYEIFGEFEWFIVPAVIVWGLFIISLDRWLMSSTITDGGGAVLRKLLPRAALSIALGIVVAEPLLLGIYNTAIIERVQKDRQNEITTREANLRTCNPIPDTAQANSPAALAASCQPYRLVISGDSPDALQSQLDQLTQQQSALKAIVDTDTATWTDLENKARLECNGTSGPGLTGRYGNGVNCKRLRNEADQFHTDHQIDQNSKQLATLNTSIINLKNRLGTAQNDYGSSLNKSIQQNLGQIRARQGHIGLLERFRTLSELVSENGYVRVTQWAIRLFLVIVDALPVILKVLSGVTAYDRILEERLASQEKAERMRSDRELDRHARHGDLIRHHQDLQYRLEFERMDRGHRIELGNYDETRGELIDALEDHLMRTASGAIAMGWQPPRVVDVEDYSDIPTQRLTDQQLREGRN